MKVVSAPMVVALLGVLAGCRSASTEQNAPPAIWIAGYYPGYRQDDFPPADIDYDALTHIFHFAVMPRADGTLDPALLGPSRHSADAVAAAHGAGKKILLTVGGAGSADGFRGAMSPANRASFVANVVGMMNDIGYDGIDLDWEVLVPSDGAVFAALVTDLRRATIGSATRPLLTAAVGLHPEIVAPLADDLDQINIMTYYMSGAWDGWNVAWHNSPLHSGGLRFASNGELVPSADDWVSQWRAAGVSAAKIGIGAGFDGAVWTGGEGTSTGGVTAPGQRYTTAPTVSEDVAYFNLRALYLTPDVYHFDDVAGVPYISIDKPGSADDVFVSYDDELSLAKKVGYVKEQKLGGLILWELGEGHLASAPAGKRDPLLAAVKHAWLGDREAGPDEFGVPDAAKPTSRCDGQYVVAQGTCSLLDDFESDAAGHAPGVLLAADGRKGSWAPVDAEIDPGTGVMVSANVESIDVSSSDLPSSRKALHFTVSGAIDWGGDVSAQFGGCYDVSGTSYSGIRFWARAASPVTILAGVHTADTHGNYDCRAANGCWGFYRRAIDLDATWRKFEIAWSDLHQPSWAILVAFNPKKVLSLVFSTQDAKPADVWIDDPGLLGGDDSGCSGAKDAEADADGGGGAEDAPE